MQSRSEAASAADGEEDVEAADNEDADELRAEDADEIAGDLTFQHAWHQRRSTIHVLAERAEARGRAARKHLVLADTTLFSQIKEPRGSRKVGLRQANVLRALSSPRKNFPADVIRRVLNYIPARGCLRGVLASVSKQWCNLKGRVVCRLPKGVRYSAGGTLVLPWHDEQCTLAEYCAYIARGAIAHIDLAAEARVKIPKPRSVAREVESDLSESERSEAPGARALEFEDVGG